MVPALDTTITQDGRLADNIVHFARVLRKAGLKIGPAAVTDAIEAVRATREVMLGTQ